MSTHRAPAKLNLCLFVGHRRDDGFHDLASIFEPLSLHDVLTVEPAAGDEVVCEIDGIGRLVNTIVGDGPVAETLDNAQPKETK